METSGLVVMTVRQFKLPHFCALSSTISSASRNNATMLRGALRVILEIRIEGEQFAKAFTPSPSWPLWQPNTLETAFAL